MHWIIKNNHNYESTNDEYQKQLEVWQRLTSLLIALLLLAGTVIHAQETAETKTKPRPERNTFESIWLIDNQTVMVPIKGTFEMDIHHRFGVITNGYDDFWGLYAPSNMRIGLNYVPLENLQIGFGFTKERKLWDFNAKYALIKQARSDGSPVSVTYMVNAAIDTREKDNFIESTDRYSYFHQLMVARKFSRKFSLQSSLSLSHFNYVPGYFSDDGILNGKMRNDHLALAFLGRYKVSSTFSIIANYDLPLTDHEKDLEDKSQALNPEPNLSFGIEVVSSSHAFQIFLGNYKSIIPQLNNAMNQETDLLIGFNITRLWN